MDDLPAHRQSLDERIAGMSSVEELVDLLGAAKAPTPALRTAVFTRAHQLRRGRMDAPGARKNWVAEIRVATWPQLLALEEALAFTGPTDIPTVARLAAHIERRGIQLSLEPRRHDPDTLVLDLA